MTRYRPNGEVLRRANRRGRTRREIVKDMAALKGALDEHRQPTFCEAQAEAERLQMKLDDFRALGRSAIQNLLNPPDGSSTSESTTLQSFILFANVCWDAGLAFWTCCHPIDDGDATDRHFGLATDMTSLLAAESRLVEYADCVPDPYRDECFRDLVDAVLNYDGVRITLPAKDPGSNDRSLRARLQRANLLQPLENADHALSKDEEGDIFDAFARHATEEVDLGVWIQFQLRNPIVTAGHRKRLGALIKDSTLEQYRQREPAFERLGSAVRLDVSTDVQRLYSDEGRQFRNQQHLWLCYAYDVFRRGFSYGHQVAKPGDAIYLPHPWRKRGHRYMALASPFATKQRYYYSWGNYLLLLGARDPLWRDIDRVIETLVAIKDAARSAGLPKWSILKVDVSDASAHDNFVRKLMAPAVTEVAAIVGLPYISRSGRMYEADQVTGATAAERVAAMPSFGRKAVDVGWLGLGTPKTERPWRFTDDALMAEALFPKQHASSDNDT